MNTSTVAKTDFIKFNISPVLKARVEKKAKDYGMTLSELGRMLFGGFVTGIIHPHSQISQSFLDMAKQAKQDHASGKGILITSKDEMESFLKTI